MNNEYTEAARTLISGRPPEKFEELIRIVTEMSGEDIRSFDAEKEKQLLVAIVSKVRSKLRKAGLRALGKTSVDEEMGIVLAMSDGIFDEMSDFGGEMGRRQYYSDVLYALRWVKSHGIDSATPERIAHDAFDAEYVLTGTFFDKLLSGDKKMMRYDAAMRILCDTSQHSRLLGSARVLAPRLFEKTQAPPAGDGDGDEG